MDQLIDFNFNEKSSVLLIFFFNAMVFTTLLLKKGIEEQKLSCFWLAGFIFLGGLYIVPFMCGYAGWYSVKSYRDFLYFMPFQQLFLIGPIFYFYIKSLLSEDFKIKKKDIIHFAPAILYLIYTLIVFMVDKVILDEFYFYADGRDKDLAFWYQFTGLISKLFYLILSLKLYQKYRQITLQEVSYADEIAFKWIKVFAIAFGIILILRVLFFILNPEWGNFGSKYWYYLYFSILLLYISITGYSNTVRFELKSKKQYLTKINSTIDEPHQEIKYEQSSQENQEEWKIKIEDIFDQKKIHSNPNLTLNDVAVMLDTNRNVISKVINQEFDMNFNDYVNEKRAKAVIKSLEMGMHNTKTLLAIAFDSGFNSKTTFNRAFKKHTTLTPKQFILQNNL